MKANNIFNTKAPEFYSQTIPGHQTPTKASYCPNDIRNEQSADTEMKDDTPAKPQHTGQTSQPKNWNVPREDPSLVAVSYIGKFIHSKRDLYSALALKGQIFLPPYDLCTLEFMGQILRKEKRAFHIFETCPVLVAPKIQRHLTIKVVLDKAKEHPIILQHLPDDPLRHLSGQYGRQLSFSDPPCSTGTQRHLATDPLSLSVRSPFLTLRPLFLPKNAQVPPTG